VRFLETPFRFHQNVSSLARSLASLSYQMFFGRDLQFASFLIYTCSRFWAGTNEHALTNYTARYYIWDHFDKFVVLPTSRDASNEGGDDDDLGNDDDYYYREGSGGGSLHDDEDEEKILSF